MLRRFAIPLAVLVIAQFFFLRDPALAASYNEYNEAVSGNGTEVNCGDDQIRATTQPKGKGDLYAIGCFIAAGDKFVMSDQLADGASVAILWQASGGRSGIARDRLGKGPVGFVNKDFAESARVWIKMGRCNQTSSNDCRDYGDYTTIRYDTWVCGLASGGVCTSQP